MPSSLGHRGVRGGGREGGVAGTREGNRGDGAPKKSCSLQPAFSLHVTGETMDVDQASQMPPPSLEYLQPC